MDWFKKHIDAVVVISTILGAVMWMNGKFSVLEKDMAIIKTVLIMKNLMPSEFAVSDHKQIPSD
jgi:hypothetical protein